MRLILVGSLLSPADARASPVRQDRAESRRRGNSLAKQGVLLDGRYRLEERIGSGGMGQVWAAFDERMRRAVAVKLLSDTIDAHDTVTVARFQREARAAGGLSSPYIVTVHDYGEGDLDGRPTLYLVMERLRGRTLDRILAEGPPTAETAMAWSVQICQALDAAHRAGLVHRDIKPANVMVTDEGVVKVLDFGIARFVGETASYTTLTATHATVGTPAYMSPEQFQGAKDIGAASDLYSFGCLLYTLLCGRPPFTGASPYALLRQHLDTAPEPPSRRRPGLSRHLDRLVLDLLQKDPRRRPADAREVARRLTGAESGPAPTGAGQGSGRAPHNVRTVTASEAGGTARATAAPPAGLPVVRPVVLATLTTAAGAALLLTWLTALGPGTVTLLALLAPVVGALAAAGLGAGEEHEAVTGCTALLLAAAVVGTVTVISPLPWWGGLLAGLGVALVSFFLGAAACGVFELQSYSRITEAAAPAAGLTNGLLCFVLVLTRTDNGLLGASLGGLGAYAAVLAALGILLAAFRP
ncbi:serine/threonine-protein kinase [Streptomyces sp. NPDC026206]|uniref:serine/threonine-protein kinase n=1 Tax=Streptomyces sp. NPDC026206 TaxID=3157089 RepID=UPI0033DB45E6